MDQGNLNESDYNTCNSEKEKTPFISETNSIEIMSKIGSNLIMKNPLQEDKNKILDIENNYEKGFEDDLKTTDKLIYVTLSHNIKKAQPDQDKTPTLQPGFKKQKGLKKYLGLILTVAAAIQFSLSALIIKVLNYHPFNLGVWRFFVMMLIPIPFLSHAIFWKKQAVFKPFLELSPTLLYLGAQAIIGSNSLVLLFFALQYLNIADAITISTSAPVFVSILAFIFLREKCGAFSIITAIVTLFGVIIISKPPALTGASSLDQSLMIGAALSFSSMMCLATCYVIIRYLRTIHHALVNLCFSVWGFGECLIIAVSVGVLECPGSVKEVILIITTAILAFFAQTCITLALKYELAANVSLVRTTEVIFAFVWQLIFLGVSPDLFSILGALIVIFAVTLTALSKMVNNLHEDHKLRRIFWRNLSN